MIKRAWLPTTFFAMAAVLHGSNIAAAEDGDGKRGAKIFRQRCAGCHINKGAGGRGPNLTDLVGGAPTARGFKYKSHIAVMSWAWTVERIDRYLQNPNEMVPGATMASQVRSQKDRTDLIAYLKTLHSPDGVEPIRVRSVTGFETAPKPQQ